MFSKESLKAAAGTFVVVLLALSVHQKFIAPVIAGKKPAVPAK